MVTAPLELQVSITPIELKNVLRGHLTKLKNGEATGTSTSVALLATLPVKKGKSSSNNPRPNCSYSQQKGHQEDSCHRKLLDDQNKEINVLKLSLKNPRPSKPANVAQLSDSDTDSSDDSKPAGKHVSTGRVKFSRAARKLAKPSSDHLSYNADTGCTDTMVTSPASLQTSADISPTPIYLADDSSIHATAAGPIRPPIPIPSIQGLVVPGLAENLLSIGQLADNGVTSVFTKDKVEFFKTPSAVSGVKLGEGPQLNKKYMERPMTSFPPSTSPTSLLT